MANIDILSSEFDILMNDMTNGKEFSLKTKNLMARLQSLPNFQNDSRALKLFEKMDFHQQFSNPESTNADRFQFQMKKLNEQQAELDAVRAEAQSLTVNRSNATNPTTNTEGGGE